MRRSAMAIAIALSLDLLPVGTGAVAAGESTAEEVVQRYLEARGGAERWRRLRSLELRGEYSAFSQRSDFRLVRAADDRYRLDFTLLEEPAVRARDETGPWWRHKLLSPRPSRITEGPYAGQLERESIFGTPLLDAAERGITVELLGSGEVEGVPTVDLRLTFADGRQESWHLDAESYLEVAIDSTVHDYTQLPEPIAQRAFYDDFREVDGLVLPFRIDLEFGHRLESLTVEEVIVDPELDEAVFRLPESD